MLHVNRGTILRVPTKIGQIAQELSKINPWWRETNWTELDYDLRDAAASGISYNSTVLADLRPKCLYVLRGPRRTGKTVAVKQKIRELIAAGVPPRSIVLIAADGWEARDLRTLVQNTALPQLPAGQNRYWFIDEISAVTGAWDKQIKWLRDNDLSFRDSTVVLTGSNAASLTAAAGTLAGRRGDELGLDRTLFPIGFRTFANLLSRRTQSILPVLPLTGLRTQTARNAYQELIPWLDELVRLWEMYLTYGGFPTSVAAAAQGVPEPLNLVEDLFQVVSADIFKASQLASHTEMALLERLWSSMASPVNLSKIGGEINVSYEVVGRHIGYLRDAFLLWQCPQRDEKRWAPRKRAPTKLYAIDPLIARLPHLRNSSSPDVDPTALTEMQVGLAIIRRAYAEGTAITNDQFLFHFKTPSRREIDFISECLAGVALEAKYCEGGKWNGDAATVNASAWDGILVTRNVLDTNSNSAWAVPAGILCYLLDT